MEGLCLSLLKLEALIVLMDFWLFSAASPLSLMHRCCCQFSEGKKKKAKMNILNESLSSMLPSSLTISSWKLRTAEWQCSCSCEGLSAEPPPQRLCLTFPAHLSLGWGTFLFGFSESWLSGCNFINPAHRILYCALQRGAWAPSFVLSVYY